MKAVILKQYGDVDQLQFTVFKWDYDPVSDDDVESINNDFNNRISDDDDDDENDEFVSSGDDGNGKENFETSDLLRSLLYSGGKHLSTQTTESISSDSDSDEQVQWIKRFQWHTTHLKSHQILVRVKSCALSRDLDIMARKGMFSFMQRGQQTERDADSERESNGMGLILGYEISGIVERVGSGVHSFKRGDIVAGLLPLHNDGLWGGYCEYCVVDAQHMCPVPGGVTCDIAAACVLPGLRAYQALHYQRNIQLGDTVLVLNGAHAMGHIAIQVANQLGARVITTASSDEGVNFLQDLSHIELSKEISVHI